MKAGPQPANVECWSSGFSLLKSTSRAELVLVVASAGVGLPGKRRISMTVKQRSLKPEVVYIIAESWAFGFLRRIRLS